MHNQPVQHNPSGKRKLSAGVIWKIIGGLLLLIIAACGITIDNVAIPASVNGGSVLPITLNVTIKIDQGQTSNFMVAVLVPKVWKTAQNAAITFTSDITSGDQAMTVIPAGTPAPQGGGMDWPTLLATKVGNGGNLLPDYEWVAFYSNASYPVSDNSTVHATVSIKIKTSPDNLLFKLGYCVANSTDGLSSSDRYATAYSGCFQVNGTGDLIDFCNPQISTVDPRTSLDNDIITLSFDGGVQSTKLDNASQVYLCISGITESGDSLSVCTQTDATKMTTLGLNKWQKDIWPRKLFNLSASQHLTGLRYWFTDASGNNKVGYAGGTAPFLYTFKCQ
ncbi:hypothetical protein A4H97_17675 [Niastella yeongjuensis]|uniref:DUF4961 domain-containing protein n=1 Tax=Niastella yeongjuensis TaxID=354355 RepID=A0A1V9E1P2_9BACT|nr:DUF4961 domain-containing protein [Niastella yeongjuensis]OQP40047.1 hypothetical protein A4H97_17675 [Niastella yeongjuensis]SEO14745.1 protein of unknown function [Niastella yeongjuensis]